MTYNDVMILSHDAKNVVISCDVGTITVPRSTIPDFAEARLKVDDDEAEIAKLEKEQPKKNP